MHVRLTGEELRLALLDAAKRKLGIEFGETISTISIATKAGDLLPAIDCEAAITMTVVERRIGRRVADSAPGR